MTSSTDKQQELASIRAQLARYREQHEELVASQKEPGFDARRKAFIDEVADSWNELADREWELMKELGDSGAKRFFETEMGLRKSLRDYLK